MHGDMIQVPIWLYGHLVLAIGQLSQGATEVVLTAQVPDHGSVTSTMVVNSWFMANYQFVCQPKISTPTEWMDIFEYPSHGKRYYRLMWGLGSKVLGSRHIPGGAVGNCRVGARVAELRHMVSSGQSREDVGEVMDRWLNKGG